MKKNHQWLNILVIVATLAVVLLLALHNQDIGEVGAALVSMPLNWILAALLCYFLFLLFEALNIWVFLRDTGTPISIPYALYVSVTGQLYSNITPGASGGQVMQIVNLRRKGVSGSVATSALLVRFFAFQLMLSVLGTAFWLSHVDYVRETLDGHMWILWLGYIYNLFNVAFITCIALVRPLVRFLAKLVVRVGAALRFIRTPEETLGNWLNHIELFHTTIRRLKPGQLLIQCLLGGCQLMALMSVIWCVYRGLGQTGSTYGELVTLDLAHYLSAAYTPMPGASGASEGVFSLYYHLVFPGGLGVAAMLLWRFFTYYISMIAGSIVIPIVGACSGMSPRESFQANTAAMAEEAEKESAEEAASASAEEATAPDAAD